MPRKPTFLYNCKHDGDQYRITKFTTDLDVESSYLCTEAECECPAGHRSTCRHRQMLPKFMARRATDTSWLFDFDREDWIKGQGHETTLKDHDPETTLTVLEDYAAIDAELHESTVLMPGPSIPPLPPGIRMLDLADISSVHNAIADALGEARLEGTMDPACDHQRCPPSPKPEIDRKALRRI